MTAPSVVVSPFASIWDDAVSRHAHLSLEPLVAPTEPVAWLRALFPHSVKHAFAPRHHALWRWASAIEYESSPEPFIGVWPRGGGKSTSAELAAAYLGLRGKRRYGLYVRDTQDRADDSVSNVATLFEAPTVERYYPTHSRPLLGKHGNARGWRRNRIRTAGGFTLDAIGLDVAARGVKLGDQRPDFIIFDDIDGKHDTPATTAKKIASLTTSLLPAGSSNVAVLGIQNLIIPDGIFARLVDGRADFLAERNVSGPFPAVDKLEHELIEDGSSGTLKAMITAGTASWDGQDLPACQALMDRIGLGAFLLECQHEVSGAVEGLALRFRDEHLEDLSDDEAKLLVRTGAPFAGMDFGAWRFGYVLRACDAHGVPHEIASYFSQNESLERRARAIHAINQHYGAPDRLRIWGDAANPTDINELNANFKRIKSPYRVVAVGMENKVRRASIERINELLDRHAIRYRRGVQRYVSAIPISSASGEPAPISPLWRVGYGAARPGIEMQGARLHWELKHWKYPIAKEGTAQKQDPDDNTADGADLIAADRYAIMSWWKPARIPEEPVDPHDPRIMAEQGNPKLSTVKKQMKRNDLKRTLTRL